MLSHVVTSKVQCFQFNHHQIYIIFEHFRDFPATKIAMIDSIYDSFWVNNQMLEIVHIFWKRTIQIWSTVPKTQERAYCYNCNGL